MNHDTTTLVRQMLEALRQIDAALDPDDWAGDLRMMDITGPAIAAADQWLAQQQAQQERKPSAWAGFLGADLDQRMAPARELVTHMLSAASELRRQHAEIERLHEERFREAAEQQLEIERLRGCLLWLLWHHQGASSPTGQPIRRALGIDQHAPMTEAQIEAGQRFGVGAACATALGVKLEGDAK